MLKLSFHVQTDTNNFKVTAEGDDQYEESSDDDDDFNNAYARCVHVVHSKVVKTCVRHDKGTTNLFPASDNDESYPDCVNFQVQCTILCQCSLIQTT